MIAAFLTSPEVMLVVGLITHVLKDLVRLGAEKNRIGIGDYFSQHPIQSALSLLGAIVGYAVLSEAGQLNAVTGFSAGYMANSVADIIGKRGAERL